MPYSTLKRTCIRCYMNGSSTLSRQEKPQRRWLRYSIIGLLTILIIGAMAFTVWAYTGGNPMPEAIDAMESNDDVTVTHDDLITFIPTDATPTSGFIFYPGGRVDARAYAPMAQAIAAEGHIVAIVPMPLRLAFFGIERGNRARERFPKITSWAVGGHSLGGVAAAIYVERNLDIDGLALWASFPNSSLAEQSELAVVSIYGTNDGLMSISDIDERRPLLPLQTEYVPIAGGNHAQFGWYGPQSGDNVAAITREEQMQQVVAATLQILQ